MSWINIYKYESIYKKNIQKVWIRVSGSFQLAIGICFFFNILYRFVRHISLYEKSSKENGITDVQNYGDNDVQRGNVTFKFGDTYVIVNCNS